jgi:hypothetical protein
MLEVAHIVVGHNLSKYDNNVMTGTMQRIYNMPHYDPFEGKAVFDTMIVGTNICKLPFQGRGTGYKPPKLIELHQHLCGEGFEKAHSAINDVLAGRRCFYILQQMAKNAEEEEAELAQALVEETAAV